MTNFCVAMFKAGCLARCPRVVSSTGNNSLLLNTMVSVPLKFFVMEVLRYGGRGIEMA